MSEHDETPRLHEAVLDAAALRALAHPLRIRILDELSAYGPLTATGLADRLGESSGATSYHLRQLEKHGLVREVKGRGTARERWWERRPGGIATPDARVFAPGSAERLATQLITNEWERGRQQNYHEFLAEGEEAFGREWIDAATSDTVNLRLTADELRAVARDVEVVVQGYIDRFRGNPSPGARPVQLHLNAFPLVRGAASDDDAPTEIDARTEHDARTEDPS
ncbi:helix-turn-helix domain-containing protein [Agromyces sp. NPDC057865]|uniref:helix-turn-helix domain-containing protein n=1 Tax=Agromyces sp. NPDC057865 TaxID=3346267 RepID=UPI00366C6AEC